MRYSKPVNKLFAALLPALLLLCMSCAARISGELTVGGAGDFTVNVSLQPRISALIRSFQAMGGDVKPEGLILDGRAIAQSMAAAPGVASVSFRNTTPSAVEGPVKIAKIGDFLASGVPPGGGRTGGFITFEQNAPAGGKCTVNLSLAAGPGILALISPEMNDYLSALMAPLATGEVMTRAEYLALVGSVYGRGIADEISNARINASIDFPGPVQSVKGGTFTGKRAEFAIPLLDVLVLETPLNYEVIWR